jgi:hypothetical protein
MELTIKIKLGNEALSELWGVGVADMLIELADRLRYGEETEIILFDANGNRVGASVVK